MTYVLAVDMGASGGRHILAHLEEGKIVLEEIYRFDNVMVERNGHLCWQMDRLWEHVLKGMAACKAAGKIPVSMGIDTWGVDYVLLDQAGQVLGDTVAYRDSRTQGMDAKLEQLEATLNSINVFNAGKMRDEAVALLAQLLPEVESFQAETQRLRDTIAHERRNASFQREINADLRNELKAERSHSFDQSMKLSELERRCKRAEKLLSKIPQEELDKLLPKQKGLER